MKIAFIGHSYHATTGSNAFVLELLRRLGEVEVFYDDSWLSGAVPAWTSGFRAEEYDCVFVFQMPEPFEWLDPRHPNLVFAPMLDRHYNVDYFWWPEELRPAKIVCFSATLERELATLAPRRFFAQHAPPIDGLPRLEHPEQLRAFFWYRRPPIDLPLLRRLTGETVFDRFTLQRAPDPGEEAPTALAPAPSTREFADVEPWLPDRASHLARLAEHTVYFAPRLYEGIGMSFLEAMALGLCVVAPDTPTHNEYIAHGATGMLYSPLRPGPLDFSRHRALGERAKEGAARRRELWEAAEAGLLEFLRTPTARVGRRHTMIDFWRRAAASASLVGSPPLPTITVVTFASGDSAHLEVTLASVAEQDHSAVEHVVVGAQSSGRLERPGARFLPPPDATAEAGEYAAMRAGLAAASNEYVLFLPAGDRFASPGTLGSLLATAPREADVVCGHFVERDDRGADTLRLIADPACTLTALEVGGVDLRWMERVPALQATAFRTSLLRAFGFDPALRFAADLDLHRRLPRAGARYHLADEVVALCAPAGTWSRLPQLSAGEWLRVAVRHGRRLEERQRLVALGLEPIEAWEQALWGWVDRVRGRARRRFPAGGPPPAAGVGRLGAGVRTVARRLAGIEHLFATVRTRLRLGSREAPLAADETYLARFADGIDFRRRGRPSFVARFAGLSWREEWGRWTDGSRLEIRFRRALPRRARLELETFAHPDVAGSPVEVAVGASTARFAPAGSETFRIYDVELKTSGREMTLELSIPLPPVAAAPGEAGAGERRRLGLALRRLRIVDLENPDETAG